MRAHALLATVLILEAREGKCKENLERYIILSFKLPAADLRRSCTASHGRYGFVYESLDVRQLVQSSLFHPVQRGYQWTTHQMQAER